MSDFSARTEPQRFQRRSTPLIDFEFRADEGAASWTFEGLACTVDHPYPVRDWLGEYEETIATGAFDRSIADPTAKISLHANHQHGKAVPFATQNAGTLEVTAAPHLRFNAELDPARPDVQILRSAIKRGEMTEMSIGFSDVKGAVDWSDDYQRRTVRDLRLREASIVEDGSNDLTMASIRSLAQEMQRFHTDDIDPEEIRRAINWLSNLLPEELHTTTDDEVEIEVLETLERGIVVTDELLELWSQRFIKT